MMTLIVRINNVLEQFRHEMGVFNNEMQQFRNETNQRLKNLEISNRTSVSRFDSQSEDEGEIETPLMPCYLIAP
ncbi:unnamed protein product [Debaryomyces fabryi]|nr:unnamed protein product [Debaryomyces fabryi]